MNAHKRDAPDRTFWTPYDYYMTERERRARRRAHAYATIAMLARRAGLFIGRLARLSVPLTQPPQARY